MQNKRLEALLMNRFGLCGCSEEDAVIGALVTILDWAQQEKVVDGYQHLFSNLGCFYIIAGLLNDYDYIEHGCAIRYAWITPKGKRLLRILKNAK